VVNWTEEQYQEHLVAKGRPPRVWGPGESPWQPDGPEPSPKVGPYRSKLEAKYANRLEIIKIGGRISDWRYEAIRLRLAKATTYTPDFLVIPSSDEPGLMILDEVKGSWKAKGAVLSRNKLKIAAEMYPWFRFRAVTYQNGIWKYEEIGR